MNHSSKGTSNLLQTLVPISKLFPSFVNEKIDKDKGYKKFLILKTNKTIKELDPLSLEGLKNSDSQMEFEDVKIEQNLIKTDTFPCFTAVNATQDIESEHTQNIESDPLSIENINEQMQQRLEKRERVFCDECGNSFASKDTLKRHVKYVHYKVRSHVCEICNKPFARRFEWRQHLLIHTGKRLFICDICNQEFTQKSGLVNHRKRHPGQLPPLPMVQFDHVLREFTKK